jgi:hypothetical protein
MGVALRLRREGLYVVMLLDAKCNLKNLPKCKSFRQVFYFIAGFSYPKTCGLYLQFHRQRFLKRSDRHQKDDTPGF